MSSKLTLTPKTAKLWRQGKDGGRWPGEDNFIRRVSFGGEYRNSDSRVGAYRRRSAAKNEWFDVLFLSLPKNLMESIVRDISGGSNKGCGGSSRFIIHLSPTSRDGEWRWMSRNNWAPSRSAPPTTCAMIPSRLGKCCINEASGVGESEIPC